MQKRKERRELNVKAVHELNENIEKWYKHFLYFDTIIITVVNILYIESEKHEQTCIRKYNLF